MPIYEFKCPKCGNDFEELCSSSDMTEYRCPKCGEMAKKKVASRVGLQFKGSGWYITDYASKSSSMAPTDEEKAKATKSASTDAPKKETTKSEKKD